MNKNILRIIKTTIIALSIIVILQIIPFLLMNILISEFVQEKNIKIVILVFGMIIFLIVDIIFYKMHISRAKYFLHTTPIECIIEDFILVSYDILKILKDLEEKIIGYIQSLELIMNYILLMVITA